MQITVELDPQHIEKLETLKEQLQKNTSELFAFMIDELYDTYIRTTL